MKFQNLKIVFKQDIRDYKKRLFIIIALCLVPSLFSGVNLIACGSVYDNTDRIPIAVVNNDKDATFNDKTVNIGNSIVKNLKKNKKLKWIFVTEKEADFGLRNGTYYASFVIPKDFSKSFTSITTSKFKKPKIIYKVNNKLTAFGSKVASSAKTSLVEEIDSSFVSEVSKTAFNYLNSIGYNLSSKNIIDMKNAVITLDNHMDDMTSALDTSKNSANTYTQLFNNVQSILPSVEESLNTIENGKTSTIDALKDVKSNINDSNNNMGTTLDYIDQQNDRVSQLLTDIDNNKTSQSEKQNSISQIEDSIDSINTSLDDMINYLSEYKKIDYDSNVNSAISSLKKLQTTLKNAKSDLQDLRNNLQGAINSGETINNTITKQITSLKTTLTNVNSSIANGITNLQAIDKIYPTSVIETLITELKALSQTNTDLMDKLTSIGEISDNTLSSLKELYATTNEMISKINTANSKVDNTLTYFENLQAQNGTYKSRISAIIVSLQNMKANNIKAKDTLATLQDQADSAKDLNRDLIKDIRDNSDSLKSELTTIRNQYKNEVKADMNTMIDNAIAILQDSYKQIDPTIEQANNLLSLLKNGSNLIANTSDDLKNTLLEFKDDIHQLSTELKKVNDSDIENIVAILQSNPKTMSDFIANPFELETESINEVPDYISNMAPLYTVLAIWMGAYILTAVIKTKVEENELTENLSIREKHFGRLIYFTMLSLIQTLIISLVNIIILNIHIANPFLFVIYSIMISLIFSLIIYTLVSLFGNLGKVICIFYMIMQLISSGGSYPIQLYPQILQILHPFLPFTYAVNGLREAVASPLAINVLIDVLQLFMFGIVFFLLGYLSINTIYHRVHKFNDKFSDSGIGL